jgi:hypothetical protein
VSWLTLQTVGTRYGRLNSDPMECPMISDIAAIDPLALTLRPDVYVRMTLSHSAMSGDEESGRHRRYAAGETGDQDRRDD